MPVHSDRPLQRSANDLGKEPQLERVTSDVDPDKQKTLGKQTPVPVPSFPRTSTQNSPKMPSVDQTAQSSRPGGSASVNKTKQVPGPLPKQTPIYPPAVPSRPSLINHPGIQKLQQSWSEQQQKSSTRPTPTTNSNSPIVIDVSSSEPSRTPSPEQETPSPAIDSLPLLKYPRGSKDKVDHGGSTSELPWYSG